MTDLLYLQERLSATNARLIEIDHAMAQNPASPSLASQARAVQSRFLALEREFLAAAGTLGIDVCSYRVFTEDNATPNAQSLARVVDAFQSLVSTVYSSIVDGIPRAAGRLPSKALTDSAFGIGYTFPGSLGVVLTVPNQRMLFGDSTLDESISVIFEMAHASTPTQLREFSARLGSASVRALYRWTRVHRASEVGADVQWRRDQTMRSRLLIQPPEISQLATAIEAASDATSETDDLDVLLVGVDAVRNSFHIRTDAGLDIVGVLSPDVSLMVDPATVPGRYKVRLTRNVITRYSLDYDSESWVLEGLELA